QDTLLHPYTAFEEWNRGSFAAQRTQCRGPTIDIAEYMKAPLHVAAQLEKQLRIFGIQKEELLTAPLAEQRSIIVLLLLQHQAGYRNTEPVALLDQECRYGPILAKVECQYKARLIGERDS